MSHHESGCVQLKHILVSVNSVNAALLNKCERCHPKPLYAPNKGTKTAEKMGLGLLPDELWSSSIEYELSADQRDLKG